MQLFKVLPLAILAAGCQTVENTDWTTSAFGTATASGITHGLTNAQSSSVSGGPGTVFFASGTDNGAEALAAIGPGVSVGPQIEAGTTATFTGRWGAVGIENIRVTATTDFEGFITGTSFRDGGPITLTADTGAGTLRGSSGALSVSGNLSGGTMDGSVSFRGVAGTLSGVAGTEGAVGAFHGNSDTLVFGGGFVAE